MNAYDMSPVRRKLLKGMAGACALPFVGAFAALHSREVLAANGVTALVGSPYGPIAPVADLSTGLPLLQLPAGFSYKSYGWRGDIMSDGRPCPGDHDGMGVIVTRALGGSTEHVLVRNHEIKDGDRDDFIRAIGVYDTGDVNFWSRKRSCGGTTNLVFRDGDWVSMTPSLGGTRQNCAGGVTPWGTWLSCEEIGSDSVTDGGKKHGYVFEVTADPGQVSGQPIVNMGRFAHEAAAVDPATGNVYLTEDAGGKSGFYRYVPDVKNGAPGSLALGGVLEMARVRGRANVNLAGAQVNETHELEWVPVPEPDADRGDATGLNGEKVRNAAGPFVQGWKNGALRMNRGEGIWYAQGRIYVMDTAGGPVQRGAIWELDLARQSLGCIYASPGELVGNMGDNLTVSPRNALLICEDGSNAITDEFGFGQRLMGLTAAGDAYVFAKNNIDLSETQLRAAGKRESLAGDRRGNEFTGVCFDPAGSYLFVNIQSPGVTFAIWGPWASGPL